MSKYTNSDLIPICPGPIIDAPEVVMYKHRMRPKYAVDALSEGYYVLITDFYSSGLAVLNELRKTVYSSYPDASFTAQRTARNAYRELSNRLLLQILNHRLSVRKAPEIGWLKILYPNLLNFILSFPQVQGMNSSWQWYTKGIFIPVLHQKIFPWYGTYFPTRYEHLELFEVWLQDYKGLKESATDIGTGSGVLTFQLLNHGFQSIVGTDSNPNAIIGLAEQIEKNKLQSKVSLRYGDLFADHKIPSELVVFNPPWLPLSFNNDGLDSAIYYDNDTFARFFADATRLLNKGGRVVVLFSNLAQITQSDKTHPIENELLTGGRFIKERYMDKRVRPASKKTKRNLQRRSDERVELWVLKQV